MEVVGVGVRAVGVALAQGDQFQVRGARDRKGTRLLSLLNEYSVSIRGGFLVLLWYSLVDLIPRFVIIKGLRG